MNIAERRFGAQQVLQGFLLRLQCAFPCLGLQLVGCRTHLVRGLLHVFYERLEFLIGARKLAAARALRERLSLLLKLGLHLRQEPGVLG